MKHIKSQPSSPTQPPKQFSHHPHDKFLLTPPSSPESLPRLTNHHKKKTSSTYEYNNRILTAKRNGNLRNVMNEFTSMKKNNVQMTHHTYNLVLEAHAILRREGTPLTNMLRIYNEMIQHQIQPNAYTYILMIRSLCKRDVEVQKTVAMLKRQSARIGHKNEDVVLLESEGNLNMALAIFHYAVADGVSVNSFEVEIFNQLLRVLSHYGDTTDAEFVYRQLEQPHVHARPNSATYAALINLFGRAGDIDTALYYYHVYNQVKDTLGPHDTSYIFNALVDCHLKCNRLEGALHVVEHDMVEHGIKLTCIPYNSIIRHYCAHNQMEDAEALIERLIQGHQEDSEKYPSPDASSYGPILSSYCQTDKWEEATRIYNALRETDIRKAYGNLANYALLCLTHQDRQKALSVIQDMTQADLEPDPVLAERMVTSFAQAEQVDSAVHVLCTLQQAMSSRSLIKGAGHLVNSALEIVLHCDTVCQVLQVMQIIMPLANQDNHGAESPSSFDIICKILIDSYFEQSAQVKDRLTTADFQLLFHAVFVVYGYQQPSCLGDALTQLLQDMCDFRVDIPLDLYEDILDQLQAYDDVELELKWKIAFERNT
ncbi:hypothetical protein CU098_002392, partial [Rhizopus stolonifer]